MKVIDSIDEYFLNNIRSEIVFSPSFVYEYMYDGEDEMDTSGVMIEDCLNNIVNTDLKKVFL